MMGRQTGDHTTRRPSRTYRLLSHKQTWTQRRRWSAVWQSPHSAPSQNRSVDDLICAAEEWVRNVYRFMPFPAQNTAALRVILSGQ